MTRDTEARQEDYSRSGEQSPGKLLVWARERAGLTQEQVAKELYMTLGKVKSLEGDDYNRLHSDTFVRGYLRAYANLVKLDVEHVLSAYDAQALRLGLVKETYVKPKSDNSNISMWRFMGLVIVALTILWLISKWFLGNRQEPEYQINAPVSTELLSTVVGSSAQNSSEVSSVAASLVNVLGVDDRSNLNEVVSSSVGELITTVAQSSAADSLEEQVNVLAVTSPKVAGLDEVEFRFKEECWLEVSDANGDVLATDLEQAGSRLTIKGKAPFEVKLGNAPSVEIYLNGKKVSIAPAIGTDVLTLKVSE